MSREPVRLTDLAELTRAERELLDAGRQLAPVQYDVAAGAARFRSALEAAAAGGGATAAGGTAAAGGLGVGTKLAALALAAGLGVWGALAMRQAPPVPAAPPQWAPVTVEARVGTAGAETGIPESGTARPLQTGLARPAQSDSGPVPRAVPPAVPTEPGTGTTAPRKVGHGPGIAPNSGRSEAAGGPGQSRSAAGKAQPGTVLHPQAGTVVDPALGQPGPVVDPAEVEAVRAPGAVVEQRKAAAAADETRAPQQVDELQSIARARVLVGRDPGAALALLQRVAREHPRGFFVEERRALTVLALAALDRDEAEQRAAAFLRDYPRSPHAARVRAAVDP